MGGGGGGDDGERKPVQVWVFSLKTNLTFVDATVAQMEHRIVSKFDYFISKVRF